MHSLSTQQVQMAPDVIEGLGVGILTGAGFRVVETGFGAGFGVTLMAGVGVLETGARVELLI